MVRGLVAHRCAPAHRVPSKPSVMGVSAMSKRQPKARRALEVTVMFEPSRLSKDHLTDAYAQVVTPCSCPINGSHPVVRGVDAEILSSLKRSRRS